MTSSITLSQDRVVDYVDRMAQRWPAHVSGSHAFKSLAVSLAMRDPAIADCSIKSKLIALNACATLGIIPDPTLGHAYLVPFNNRKANQRDVQLIIGYRGFIELARRSGYLTSVTCREVYQNDEFLHQMGTEESITHRTWRSTRASESGPLAAAYCVAHLRGGGTQIEVMYADEIDSVRKRSRAKGGPWDTDFAMMARKTVLRRAAKTWPLSADLALAVEADERSERGESPLQTHDLPAPEQTAVESVESEDAPPTF